MVKTWDDHQSFDRDLLTHYNTWFPIYYAYHLISYHIIYKHNIFNHDKHFSEADIPFSKTTQDDAWHIAYQHWPAQGGATLAGLDVPDVSHVVNYSLGLSVPRRAECMHSKLFKLSWRFVIRECCWNCLGYLLVCPLWLINTRVASRDARVIFSWVFGLWSYTVNIDMIWKSNGFPRTIIYKWRVSIS